ncbi:MAG: FAD:protein FMN transferase [Solirubrobacterales bacterium]|nr:FAD:protein FMN transferase [Solirubrobacterales bacterium]
MAISQQETARFDALGSIATVAVSDSGQIGAAVDSVQETVAAFDRACSRFREDSELSAVNASAGRALRVSPLMIEAVGAALRAARLTDGDVDPTVGRALIALGYDRDFDSLPTGPQPKAPVVSFASVPGWRTVELDAAAGTIRVPRGVALDLGATAKALCADRAAADAHAAAGCGVLVSLGGDMAVAGDGPADGWRVRVTDDHRSDVDAPGQWISIRSGGLATSSTAVRRWETGSGSMHHLVDPGNGRPVTSAWRTVSVTAASCLDANIASTAAIVRGERAAEWLESLGLPSRLVGVEGVARHVAGWPTEGDELA